MAEKTSRHGAERPKRRSSEPRVREPGAAPALPVVRSADELFSCVSAAFEGPVLVLASPMVAGEGRKLRALLVGEVHSRMIGCVLDVAEPAPASAVTPRLAPHILDGLSNGERGLLEFLAQRPGRWFSSFELAQQVYRRNDAAGRQLVWKYASTLRRKLDGSGQPIRACRTRGYSCSTRIDFEP